MAKFKIQVYNREMTEKTSEYDKEFDLTGEALVVCYDLSGSDRIVVLERELSPHRWRIIAKFY